MNISQELLESICRRAREMQPEIEALGEAVWRNPETGYREIHTGELLAEKLEMLGLPVHRHLALTGLRAELDSGRPGPVVGIVGELDALLQPSHPAARCGVVHACGHHTHAAALYGAAAILRNPEILEKLCGKMVFIAAPAEEAIETDFRRELMDSSRLRMLCGKSQLIREGVFDDIDIAFMNHIGCGDQFGAKDCNGFVSKQIIFTGKAAHAAYPAQGINALNGCELARHAIALLRESVSTDPTVRIHGIISEGGKSVSTLPESAVMDYMIRAGSIERLHLVSESFDDAVLYSARALGVKAEIRTFYGAMPLKNSDALADVVRELLEKVFPGKEFRYRNGHDYGCTDMGDVSQIKCALHLGVPGGGGQAHQDSFHIADPVAAYSGNAQVLALLTAELLCCQGRTGYGVCSKESRHLSISEYLQYADRMNSRKMNAISRF